MSIYGFIMRWHQSKAYRFCNSVFAGVFGKEAKQRLLWGSTLKYRHKLARSYSRNWSANVEALVANVKANIVPANHPMLLISEVQRSGGSLLSQLFDLHPQCHVHPHEVKIGYPKKTDWPELDLDGDREAMFLTLFEYDTVRFLREGYKKDDKDSERHQFLFLPALQRELFLAALETRANLDYRAVIEAYMTSFFNAWLNNRNLHGEKRWVVGFVPGFSSNTENVSRLFSVYPEGRLVSLLRDPLQWYCSAKRHRSIYKDMDYAMDRWCESAQAMLDNVQRYPDAVSIISFADLVAKTEQTTRRICALMNIDWRESMLSPTVNGEAIISNSSFESTKGFVSSAVLTRPLNLTKEEEAYVMQRGEELYEKALQKCLVVE